MLHHFTLLDTWTDLASLFQDSKTWDFIGNVGYAAAIGIGGFVVRKFGLKIRKNAAAIGEITTDVLALTKENEALKLKLSQVEVEKNQLRTDYVQQQDSYKMLSNLFELSKLQWGARENALLLGPPLPQQNFPAPKELPRDTTENNK